MTRRLSMLEDDVYRIIDEYIGSGGRPDKVLDALYETMMLTAEHLSVHWQDEKAAMEWERAAKEVERLSDRLKQQLLLM